MTKLNLGSGPNKLDGYKNIDLLFGTKAYPLDVPDESCDEIRASHLLEHFPYERGGEIIKHWVSKLKPGGILKIAVPDFGKIVSYYQSGQKQPVQQYLMGGHVDENDFHQAIYDETSLRQAMEACGLIGVTTWNDGHDCCNLDVSLNLQGTRSGQVVSVEQEIRLAAVMSMPRLCFTDNIFTAQRAFLPLGVDVQKGTGVYWSQVLTDMMEQHLDKDYIITLDYDSFFHKNHVIRLCQHMQENPDVDAIVPVQVKREGESTLFGCTKEQEDANGVLVPITTGHFGLTIFRTTALKQLTRPWFLGVPNKHGRWKENRMDPDIYFWHKFVKEGHTAMLAKDVCIGHLQMMCTFPGHPKDSYRPVHRYMNNVNKWETVPDHCIPEVELLT